jgi:hypothetical protein
VSTMPQRRVQLHVQLSDSWVVADPAEWETRTEYAHVLGIGGRDDTITHTVRPDLVASLLRPVGTEDELVAVVMASLVAWTYSSDEPPALPPGALDGRVLTGIEVSPGISADFYVRTVVLESPETATTAFLTFSTPNLPLIAAMDAAFQSIADTAYLDLA